MHAPLTVPSFQLKAELASGHYLHLKHGVLCYGEKLKAGVIQIHNTDLRTELDAQNLINLIDDTKDPVAAVKLYIRQSAEVKSEIVLGSPCTTALWCTKNLATFSEITKKASPSLHDLNQKLQFYRFRSGETFPESMPISRIPSFENFNNRARLVFYHSEATEVIATRYCFSNTHQEAITALVKERSFCGKETKSYNLLNASFLMSNSGVLHVFIPRGAFPIDLENRCFEHLQKVMLAIDPTIKVHLEFTDHCLF